MYGYSDINSFLQTQTGKVDPEDKDSDFIFTLYFDMTTFRVVILMHENYELDFSEGEFAELLGYEKKILTGEKNFVGPMVPNITRSVDKLINQLYVSLGSIKAGNSSIKLQNGVFSLLDSLVELGAINEKRKKKIVRNYIGQ